jgi:outer membrane protein TolC
LAGQTSILTLLEAQKLLLESRRGDIAVRLELATAISELEQRVGEQMGNDPAAAGPTSESPNNLPPATAAGQ